MKKRIVKISFGLILLLCVLFVFCENPIMSDWWDDRSLERSNSNFAVIVFDSDGGSPSPKAIKQIYDIPIGRLQPMTRVSGDVFIGWFDERGRLWDVEKDPVRRSDVNSSGLLLLTARWTSAADTTVYTVTFNAASPYGGTNPPPQNVAAGNKVVQPLVPRAQPPYGYGFDGWFDESGNFWDFDTNTVNQDIELTARWVTNYCIVRFHENGGTRPDGSTTLTHEFTISHNMGIVPHPGPLIKEGDDKCSAGYYFGGWYAEVDNSFKLWDFENDRVSGSYPPHSGTEQVLNLFARWIPKTRTIIFDQNGGQGLPRTVFEVPVDTRLIDPGNPGNPGTPTRTGFTPRGWFPDPACTPGTGLIIMDWKVPEPDLFSEIEPIYFYAGWTPSLYYVTFNIVGHGPVTGDVLNQTVQHGNLLERPIIMPAPGRHLDGKWYKTYDTATGIFSNEWNFDTDVIISNTDLYARYNPDGFTVTFNLNSPINGAPPGGYGGLTTPPTQNIVSDGTGRVIEPFMPPPSGSGVYSFLYWARSDGTRYNFNDLVTSDLELYARWVEALPDMVWVPRGSFVMGDTGVSGSPAAYHAYPIRRITLDGFYISKYMITQRTYPALSGDANGLRGFTEVMGINPSQFTADPDRPVENVSWAMAMDYCDRLNSSRGLVPHSRTSLTNPWATNGFRLPTEAEWEFAARGGYYWQEYFTKNYIYAGSSNAMDVAWYNESVKQQPAGSQSTQPVGKKLPNQLGIYDMSGNLSEWCYDWFASYSNPGQPGPNVDGIILNPAGPASGAERVRRGGAWNNAVGNVRVTVRNSAPPSDAHWALGFRVVRGPANIW